MTIFVALALTFYGRPLQRVRTIYRLEAGLKVLHAPAV